MSGALTSRMHKGTDSDGNFVVPAEPEVWQQQGSKLQPMGTMRRGNGNVTGGVPFVAHALTAEGFDASEDGTGRGTPIVPVDLAQVTSRENRSNPKPGDPNGSLAATSRSAVAYALRADPGGVGQGHNTNLLPVGFGETGGDLGTGEDLSPSVRTGSGGGSTSVAAAAVRRLTPVECERLQGYPTVLVWEESMSKDEFIAAALAAGTLICDPASGLLFRTRGPGGTRLAAPASLAGSDCNGYLVSKVSVGGIKRQVRHNRVVWIASHGLPSEGMAVCHRDDDKKNNAIGNLYLATSQQNSSDAAASGRYLTGDDDPASKLPAIRRRTIAEDWRENGLTIRALADRYGISKSRVHQIVHEAGWTETSNGRPQADSARYRQIGNSIAVPVFAWVARRIVAVDSGTYEFESCKLT